MKLGWAALGLLAAVPLALHCASADPPEPCTDAPPKCVGDKMEVCNNGTKAVLDCTAKGLKCVKNGKDEGVCAKPCPKTMDKYGACQGTHMLTCDGDALVDTPCAEGGMGCGYMVEGYASCTKPCPSFVDGLGACTGTGMRRCNGQVFFDLNCLDLKKFCGTEADGTAQCTDPCPDGVDVFGACDGDVMKRCDGAMYKEADCAKAGKKCEKLDRFGVGCRGCGETTVGGVCSPTWVLSACSASGEETHESCVAQGGSCAFSAGECRNACVGKKPPGSCAAAKLAEGKKRCHENPFTHFQTIQACKDGRVWETECPAASDGSVTCAEKGGAPTCETTCGPAGRRCTDRGVLVACTTAGLAWIDCAELGAECKDDGKDAFCACAEVPEYAARCTTDMHGWAEGLAEPPAEDAGAAPVIDAGAPPDGGAGPSLQYQCVDGRITVAPCACAGP